LFCKKREYAGSGGGKIDKIVIMKKYFLIGVLLFLVSCSSTKNFPNSSITNPKEGNVVIAILPAIVSIHVKEKEKDKISQEALDNGELKLGFIIQNELYKRMQKNKYTVTIQQVKLTNDKLFASGMSFSKYKTMTKYELAKILEVDAVIFTKANLEKMSYKSFDVFLDTGSPGSFLLGAALTAFSAATAKEIQTDKIKLKVGIVDTKNGIEIWQRDYYNEPSSYIPLDEFFVNSLKNASKFIPYRK
jgi:hypothetical protein